MSKEHFDEINALIKAIATALTMDQAAVAAAFDANEVTVTFVETEDGKRLLDVRIGERSALVGFGASQPD